MRIVSQKYENVPVGLNSPGKLAENEDGEENPNSQDAIPNLLSALYRYAYQIPAIYHE